MTREIRPARPSKGFILPITVMILALVSVGLSLMAQRSEDLRTLIISAQAEKDAAAMVSDATAEALFLSSAMYRRKDSLDRIHLDGRFYRSSSGALVSYKDAGALLSLRRVTREEIQGLLLALGLHNNSQRERLADVLLDYTDADDLLQLNGAESAEYVAAKLPPPRNGRLLTPTELKRLLGWRDLPEEFWSRLLDHVHVGSQRTLNRHTVDGPVLSAASGLEPTVAAALVGARQPGTMLGIESLPTVVNGSYLAAGRYISVPSITLLLKICPPNVSWCQHLAVTTSGESAHAPWHIDYSYRLQRTRDLPEINTVEALPDQLPDTPPPPLYSPFELNNSPP